MWKNNFPTFFPIQLSKEVKKLRDFEEGLLKHYQEYLQILETTVEGTYLLFLFIVVFSFKGSHFSL